MPDFPISENESDDPFVSEYPDSAYEYTPPAEEGPPESAEGTPWEGMDWRDEGTPEWRRKLRSGDEDVRWRKWQRDSERWEREHPRITIRDQAGSRATRVVGDQPITFDVALPGAKAGKGETIDVEIRCGNDSDTFTLAWHHTDDLGVPHFVSNPVTIKEGGVAGDAVGVGPLSFSLGHMGGLEYRDGDVVVVAYNGTSTGAQVFTSATKLELAALAGALGEAGAYFTTLLVNLRGVQEQLDASADFEGKDKAQEVVTQTTAFANQQLDITRRGVEVLGYEQEWADHERLYVVRHYVDYLTRPETMPEWDPRVDNDKRRQLAATGKEEAQTIVFRGFVDATIGAYRLIVQTTGAGSIRMLAGGLLSLIPTSGAKTLGLNTRLLGPGENELGQKATPFEYFMSALDLTLMGASMGAATKFQLDTVLPTRDAIGGISRTQPRLQKTPTATETGEDALHLPPYTVVNPNNYGMLTPANRHAQAVVRNHNVVVTVRPTNPRSMGWRATGAAPKSEKIKTKTLDEIDELIGGPEGYGGCAPAPFNPRLPAREGFTDVEWDAIVRRFEQRKAEFDGPVGDKTRKLVEDGEFIVKDGVMHTRDGRPVTGDHDMFEVSNLDGTAASPEVHLRVTDDLRNGWFDAQHPAHMRWDPQRRAYVTDEAFAADRKMFEGIVDQHQLLRIDKDGNVVPGEALLTFAPNRPPFVMYAGQAAGWKPQFDLRGLPSPSQGTTPFYVHPGWFVGIVPTQRLLDGTAPAWHWTKEYDWWQEIAPWREAFDALPSPPAWDAEVSLGSAGPVIRVVDGSLECDPGSLRVLEHGGDCPALEVRCEGQILFIESMPGTETECMELRFVGGGLCNGERVESCVLETGSSCQYPVEGAERMVLDGVEYDADGGFSVFCKVTDDGGWVRLKPGESYTAARPGASAWYTDPYSDGYGEPKPVESSPSITCVEGRLEFDCGSCELVEPVDGCASVTVIMEDDRLCLETAPSSCGETSCVEFVFRPDAKCGDELIKSCTLNTGSSFALRCHTEEQVFLDGVKLPGEDGDFSYMLDVELTGDKLDAWLREKPARPPGKRDESYPREIIENPHWTDRPMPERDAWTWLGHVFMKEDPVATEPPDTAWSQVDVYGPTGPINIRRFLDFATGWFEAFRSTGPRSKSSEAKSNLKAAFTVEKAFFQEKDRYSSLVNEVGFSPERSTRYSSLLTPGEGEDVAERPINVDVFKYGETGALASDAPDSAWSPSGPTFTGQGGRELDAPDAEDDWSISSQSGESQSHDEPASESNDVTTEGFSFPVRASTPSDTDGWTVAQTPSTPSDTDGWTVAQTPPSLFVGPIAAYLRRLNRKAEGGLGPAPEKPVSSGSTIYWFQQELLEALEKIRVRRRNRVEIGPFRYIPPDADTISEIPRTTAQAAPPAALWPKHTEDTLQLDRQLADTMDSSASARVTIDSAIDGAIADEMVSRNAVDASRVRRIAAGASIVIIVAIGAATADRWAFWGTSADEQLGAPPIVLEESQESEGTAPQATNEPSGTDAGEESTLVGAASFSSSGQATTGGIPVSAFRFGERPARPVTRPGSDGTPVAPTPTPVMFTVTIVNNGGGNLRVVETNSTCPPDCTIRVESGRTLTIVADGVADLTGACTARSSCQIVVTGDASVVATFLVAVSAVIKGDGSAEVNGTTCVAQCVVLVPFGSTVEVTHNAASGSHFVVWENACTGSGACVFTAGGTPFVGVVFQLDRPAPPPETEQPASTGSSGSSGSSGGSSGGSGGSSTSFDWGIQTPPTVTVTAGGSTSTSLISDVISGTATGPATLDVTGAPAGVTVSFGSGTITIGSSTSVFISAAADTTPGTYPLTFSSTIGGDVRTSPTTLTVNAAPSGDFSFLTAPSSLTIPVGGSNCVSAMVVRTGGHNAPISVSSPGKPAGVSNGSTTIASGSSSAVLCFFVGASASTGSSTFPVVADDGSLLKTTTFTLNVTGTFLARPRWGREIKRRVAMPEPAIVAPSPENASAADAAEVANDLSTYTTPVVRKRRVGALPARQVVALAAATRPAASIAEAEAPAAPEPEPEPELPPELPPAREPESETSLDAPS